MRHLIIGNPLIGIRQEKKAVIDKLVARLKKDGATVDVTYILERGKGKFHASRSKLEGYDRVYAAGGDGTVSEVASGLVGLGVPLGIVPLGTGNGLARSLNIPLETESMIHAMAKGKTDTIDCGQIGDVHFFATAGFGFDAWIAQDFNIRRKEKTSVFDYFMIGVKNYLFRPPEKVTIEIDGKEITRKLFALSFCNTKQYGGGAIIAPQADTKSGTLIAALIPKLSLFKVPAAIMQLFNGTLEHSKNIEYHTFTSLTISRGKNDIAHADGEIFHVKKTFTVNVLPQSLNVIVP